VRRAGFVPVARTRREVIETEPVPGAFYVSNTIDQDTKYRGSNAGVHGDESAFCFVVRSYQSRGTARHDANRL